MDVDGTVEICRPRWMVASIANGEKSDVSPMVHKAFPLDEVSAALSRMAERRTFRILLKNAG